MNQPIVMKFGGTSLARTELIESAARRVLEQFECGFRPVVVVSAMAGETNRLIQMARLQSGTCEAAELDLIAAVGEQIAAALMAIAIKKLGGRAVALTAAQVGIVTNDVFGDADILNVDSRKILSVLESNEIPVVTGFQGVTECGRITTLGRGGSDTTAVAIAAALQRVSRKFSPAFAGDSNPYVVCEIYTDVDGVYTADPQSNHLAQKFASLSYEQMAKMADQGAKVLHNKCVRMAQAKAVPIHVRSSFGTGEGTWIAHPALWFSETSLGSNINSPSNYLPKEESYEFCG